MKKWHFSNQKEFLDNKQQPIYWLNVGSSFELSIKELANKISKAIDFRGEILWNKEMPDGTPRKKLDTSKINNLGWYAKTDIDQGIKLTINHYKKELSESKLRE